MAANDKLPNHGSMSDKASKKRLPYVLHEIAMATDLETALLVAKSKGGVSCYFSPNPGPGHWLSRLVGLERATRIGKVLCSHVGVEILVPMGRESFDKRNEQIMRMVSEGKTTRQIALALGVHQRTIAVHKRWHREFAEITENQSSSLPHKGL
jgi:Bacterial regulatory proteins, luxR family